MIVKVFREPTDSIMRLYGQPVLLHDVLIVGKLSSVIPPITDDASINAKIDLDPDLPPEVVYTSPPSNARKSLLFLDPTTYIHAYTMMTYIYSCHERHYQRAFDSRRAREMH